MTPERERRYRDVIRQRQNNLAIVLENIWDPHNVSAILRTADSVGILDVYLIYNNQEFPKLGKKSSAGSKKWMDLHPFTTVEDCYAVLREKGFKIFATHLGEDSHSLYDLNLSEKVALVFGNEHSGVSKPAYSQADGNFLIPQTGFVKSLNVSVAAAVTLYEAFRQRRENLEVMTPHQQQQLFERWQDIS